MSAKVIGRTGKMRRLSGGVLVWVGLVGFAAAQDPGYRDQPPVLPAPDYGPSSQQRWEQSFDLVRARYAERGPIRMAVYWGRKIDTETHTNKVDYEVSEKVGGSAQSTVRVAGFYSESESGAQVNAERSATVKGSQRVSSGESSALAAHQGWDLESRFNEVLRHAGVSLVRSDLAARNAGMSADGDANALEMHGLNKSADLILEVLGRPDGSQPSGWQFRVLATEVKSSRVVADFVTSAIPPADSKPRYVASDDGFVRESARPVEERDVAQQLALEVAQQLLRAGR